VVGLSFGVGMVSGNLLEVTYKLLTLPVAPLFVLFYMAMFVPWSTPFGAIVAATVSMAVAIGIGFFELMGLGFIWIIPVSLIVGIVVGMLASLVPVARLARGG
jgi:SSS family solute:Na+ symporter